MIITILDNKYCKITANEDETPIINQLRNFLSYKLAGVEYTPAYKNGWHGITFLLNKQNVFMSGLLPKVEQWLKRKQATYTITDNRIKSIAGNELIITDRLKHLNKVPRDYQNRILEATTLHDKGIIRACTASGKTLVAAMMTAKFNKPTIVYVIGLNLLDQFHKTFTEIFDEPIGRIGNGDCDIKRITIASIWTIGKALDINTKKMLLESDEFDEKEKFNGDTKVDILRALKEYKIHMLDECHVSTTATISAIYKNINPERIYGLSGTPFRGDNSDLLINGVLGEQIINISASELIEKGILAKPYIKFITVPKMHIQDKTYQAIYKQYIVENEVRNNLVVEYTKKFLEKGYAPLVLFKQIVHGKILLEMLQNAGVKCDLLYGNDKLERRLEVMQDFNDGKIDVIVASVIFDLGVDLPKISALVNAGGGASAIRCLQKVGRCIRPYPGKKHVAICDFFDQIKYLRDHSKKRFKIYSSEVGFEVSPSKEML